MIEYGGNIQAKRAEKPRNKKLISFANDYTAGAHPAVLQKLIETNAEALSGYGCDWYSDAAKKKIRAACGCPDAEVYFLVGGTQTNQVVLGSLLDDCEGALAAKTGHISVREAGAIEYTGHKVIALRSKDGKLSAGTVREYLTGYYADGGHGHMVYPGVVYITYPTEYGTLYSKKELTELYSVCKEYSLPLYIDGARLGYGLASSECDITLPELAGLCDAFYIGGTKVGALCGEAVVFTGTKAPRHFITKIKQHGALLAKGRLLGVQFDALFTDGLYMKISRHAIDMAMQLREILAERGYRFYVDSPTNQQFVILGDEEIERLRGRVDFSVWERYDEGHAIVRFATSWATTGEEIDGLRRAMAE